jgi:hypothetical protein
MNAVVKYSNGVNMSCSLNSFMPIEKPVKIADLSTL